MQPLGGVEYEVELADGIDERRGQLRRSPRATGHGPSCSHNRSGEPPPDRGLPQRLGGMAQWDSEVTGIVTLTTATVTTEAQASHVDDAPRAAAR